MQMEATTALLPAKRCTEHHNFYLYSLAAVASVGGLLFGYDTGIVSGAMVLIRNQTAIINDDLQQEAIVSSTTGLAAVGALASGTVNRVFGRKPVLVTAAVIFTIGAVVMALANTFATLLTGRMVVGVAVGLASSTVPLYIAELAPAHMRGLLVSVNNACIVIGQVLAAIVAGFLSADTTHGWRYMLGLGGVPSALQLVGLVFLPESPRWLLAAGREDEARAVLQKLHGTSADQTAAVEYEISEVCARPTSYFLLPTSYFILHTS